MRFEIVMNMPVRVNHEKEDLAKIPLQQIPLIHRIIVEHPSRSLEEFVDTLERHDFVIVEELFYDSYMKDLRSNGMIAINHRYIGKIKASERQNESQRYPVQGRYNTQ